MSQKDPVTPEDSQPRSVVEIYHRVWTGGDVKTAMAFVTNDVSYHAPGVDPHDRSEHERFISGFTP